MRILYLCNKRYYNRKMSRVRFHSMKAINSLVDVDWWGIGWKGYDNNLTVKNNLNNLESKPDLIVAYFPLEMKDFKSLDIPKCLRYNEMYDFDYTKKEIIESGTELVICHLKNAMPPYQEYFKDSVKFIHIPHGAEKTIFKEYKLPKKISVLHAGNVRPTAHPLVIKLVSLLIKIRSKFKSKKFKYQGYVHQGDGYPFRTRLAETLELMDSKYKWQILKHPGTDLKKAYTDKYAIKFAKAINSSKIVVTCSGMYKYRLAKYPEIAMCGTAIAGDLPDQDQEDFREFLIELNENMTDDEIIKKLVYYLENEDQRQKLVEKGLKWSQNYTQEDYAKRFIQEVDIFLRDYYKNK